MPNKPLNCDKSRPHLHEVTERVYLGTRKSTNYPSLVKSYGITHIVSFHKLDQGIVETFKADNIKYYFFEVVDQPETNWDEVWDMIQGALACFLAEEKKAKKTPSEKQPKILFQCALALRRSPLFLCCFLVAHRGFTPIGAMKRVTEERRCAGQPIGFYRTSLPLLERLGGPGYTLPAEEFDPEEWDDEHSSTVYVKQDWLEENPSPTFT